MKLSLRLFSSSLLLGMVCWCMQAMKGEAQTVLAVNEIRVVSTSGIVAAKSADGKTVTISLANVPVGETPIVAKQGPGSTLATGAASEAFITIPDAGTFRMGADTQVKLPAVDEKGSSLELLKGRLFLNINAEDLKKRGNATFRLKTPTALLAVKGTRFFAISADASDTAGVNQGSVEVLEPTSNQTLVLNTGSAVSIRVGVMGKERPLTPEESIYEKFYAMDAPKGGFTNSLGMKFVPVPGTQVQFCIHETRYQDYAAYAAAVPGVNDLWKTQEAGITDGADHPVTKVSWEDAQAFCAWLSKKEGKTYRLPTDQEWSYAVGIGTMEKRTQNTTPSMLSGTVVTQFPWGTNYPPQTADRAGNYADTSYHEKNPNIPFINGYTDDFATTAPVLSFKPNKLGLYDLGGNAWEWCEDWYDTTQKARVLRGGSWDDCGRGSLLSSHRNHYAPGARSTSHGGFRVVVVPGSAPKSAGK